MFRLRLVIACALAIAGVVDAAIDHHEVLGLTRAATFEEIQVSFKDYTGEHATERNASQLPSDWFVDALTSYEAISNKDMQADALSFIDYWADIKQLKDDVALRQFTEFQPGGSSRLRMIIAVESEHDRSFEVYSTATKYAKHMRVAQIAKPDVVRPGTGEQEDFFKNFKLSKFPAVILFDPMSRGMKVKYGLTEISSVIDPFLRGQLVGSNQLGAIKELDEFTHPDRCANKTYSACRTSMIFAVSPELEKQHAELIKRIKPFVQSCGKLQEKEPGAPCFWLRLGRAPQWQEMLSKKGVPSGDVTVFSILTPKDRDTVEVSVAGARVTTSELAIYFEDWFKEVIANKAQKHALAGGMPEFPKVVTRDEEPTSKAIGGSDMQRMLMQQIQCFFSSECRNAQMETLHLQLLQIAQAAGYEATYVQLTTMDMEMKLTALGLSILLFFVLMFVCQRFCCGKRRDMSTEDGVIDSLEFMVQVTLKRDLSGGQKFGFGISSDPRGGLQVTSVDNGGLLDQWNQAQARPERRIAAGDRIVSAAGGASGRNVEYMAGKKMITVLKADAGAPEVSMMLLKNKHDPNLVKVVGTCILEDLALQGNAEFCSVPGSGGQDLEVTSIGPAIQQWNESRRAAGSCCTQTIEVGDRIVSVNGNVNVQSQLGAASAAVTLVRWRQKSSISIHSFQVAIEKASEQERWGMQIRRRVAEPFQMEVLEIVGDGLLAQWNNNPANPKVMKGDRMIAANGLKDLFAITNALQEPKLKLDLERWVDSSSGAVANGAAANGAANGSAPVPAMGAPPPMPGALGSPAPGPPGVGVAPFGKPQAAAAVPPAAAMAPITGMPPVNGKPALPTPAPMPTPMQPMGAPVQSAAPFAPAPMAPMAAPAPMPAMAPRPSPPVAMPAPSAAQMPASSTPILPFIAVFGALAALLAASASMSPTIDKASPRYPPVQLSPEVKKFLFRIHPDLYMEISILMFLLGALFTILFIRGEVHHTASMFQSLCVSACASTLLGFGGFFMMVSSGIYV